MIQRYRSKSDSAVKNTGLGCMCGKILGRCPLIWGKPCIELLRQRGFAKSKIEYYETRYAKWYEHLGQGHDMTKVDDDA